MLEKVDALLTEVGSDREHLLSATIYVNDMSLFKEMNEVWDNWLPTGHAPVRACVEAAMANPEYLAEGITHTPAQSDPLDIASVLINALACKNVG